MLYKVACCVGVFWAICAIGFSQHTTSTAGGSKDFSQECGVNLVLERTIKRRTGELDSELDPNVLKSCFCFEVAVWGFGVAETVTRVFKPSMGESRKMFADYI